ncbi:S4 domain-containing protein, partial [Staphylococcus aureus]
MDNTVFRMGLTASRPEARQLVNHKHITVNGEVMNVPSYSCKPGDVIAFKPKSADNSGVTSKTRGKNPKFGWVDWNESEKKGTFIT